MIKRVLADSSLLLLDPKTRSEIVLQNGRKMEGNTENDWLSETKDDMEN